MVFRVAISQFGSNLQKISTWLIFSSRNMLHLDDCSIAFSSLSMMCINIYTLSCKLFAWKTGSKTSVDFENFD